MLRVMTVSTCGLSARALMMRKSAGARIGSSVPTSRHLRLRLCEVGIHFSSHCRVGIVPPAGRRVASVKGTWPFAFKQQKGEGNTLIAQSDEKRHDVYAAPCRMGIIHPKTAGRFHSSRQAILRV